MVPGHGPAKGDQNPYGVAVVSHSTGGLVRGDVLVSNFNNAKNEQGTGSSIVEVSPRGRAHVCSTGPWRQTVTRSRGGPSSGSTCGSKPVTSLL
jgi:hypothetical protein